MKRNRIRVVLEMIKFEHSIFALPFALTGALLAARASRHGWPTLWQVAWIVVAMVAARSAAMTINRIVDLRYDRENPRTNKRALATGDLSVSFAWVVTLVAVGVFLVAARQLNRLALELARKVSRSDATVSARDAAARNMEGVRTAAGDSSSAIHGSGSATEPKPISLPSCR